MDGLIHGLDKDQMDENSAISRCCRTQTAVSS
jgi:hypothetical protein